MMSSGCRRPAVRSSRTQLTNSDISRGVSKGVAVWKTTPICTPFSSKAATLLGVGFVMAAMPGILFAISEQVPMQLLDVVFGERDVLPGRKHLLHQLRVSGDLLLVAGSESLDFKLG